MCDGDCNNDGFVNALDLGSTSKFFINDPDADLNGNGVVNVMDLGGFRQMFFQPPGPSGLNRSVSMGTSTNCLKLELYRLG